MKEYDYEKHLKLSDAVRSGYEPEIYRQLRKLKHNPYGYFDIQFALLCAAARDMTEVGQALIDSGANVNYGMSTVYPMEPVYNPLPPPDGDDSMRPPIFNALECASFAFTRMLLRCGAELNVFDDKGTTPLVRFIWAIPDFKDSGQSMDCYYLLEEHGADLDFGHTSHSRSTNDWLRDGRRSMYYPFERL